MFLRGSVAAFHSRSSKSRQKLLNVRCDTKYCRTLLVSFTVIIATTAAAKKPAISFFWCHHIAKLFTLSSSLSKVIYNCERIIHQKIRSKKAISFPNKIKSFQAFNRSYWKDSPEGGPCRSEFWVQILVIESHWV